MDKKLLEAAQTGNVQNFHQLVGENPLMLHISALDSAGNPLLVASSYGHTDFVKENINLRLDLAQKFNQDGFGPMYTESIGHRDVARELQKVDRKLYQLQGPEGKIPLHGATIRRKVKCFQFVRKCVEDVTTQLDTALQLAVKNNQFRAIKILVYWIREMKEDFFNVKDEQGNRVLPLATRKKQRWQFQSKI